MKLRLFTPVAVLVDAEVDKVQARAVNGSFCLLTHHIDFVSALVPGVLAYRLSGAVGSDAECDEIDEELDLEERRLQFISVDSGILVKKESEVFVSVRRAEPIDRPARKPRGAGNAKEPPSRLSDRGPGPETEADINILLEELERDFVGRHVRRR